MSRPDWPVALPEWAERGDTVVGRLLRTLKAGGSDFPDDVQTRRILVVIDDIRRRRRPRYHHKMRAVDVANLERFETFCHTVQCDTTVVHAPIPYNTEERLVRTSGEAPLKRGLRVLADLANLYAEYATLWISPYSFYSKRF
jgi:hypothetical protein